MNSIERITAAVNFGQPDRVPVIPQIFGHSAILAGHTLIDYVRNGDTAADCQLQALDRYDGDTVFAAIDVCIETEAIGGDIRFRPDIYPAVERPPLTAEDDFSRLALPDPLQAARMPELLRMATRLREAVADERLVVGIVQGPMTLAVQFLGAETALYLAVDDPGHFEQLLDFNTEVALRWGLAQLQAGVHLPMVFEPAGCPEVVPAAFFREFIAPRLKRLFTAYRDGGALISWLHIAGQSLPILPSYAALGIDIGNFDYPVDPLQLQQTLPQDTLCVDGNIKPLLFVEGTPEEVEAESLRLIQIFEKRGGFILSSGCEIPPEAKPENIEAMVQAARRG
ncbi:MAG: uroporphyrinogen decarboxylase family protein [Chromatiales bacterium]|jgi:uroporphyrinogen decarboxylase